MVLPGFIVFIKFILFILLSWILVHLLAIFGVFLAFSLPVWWLLVPKTFCLFCRIKKTEKCYFHHSLLNAGLVLFFSFVSLALVFAESKILYKMGFPPTPKTVSFVIPPKGQYRLGEMFPLKIEIAGIKVPVNAVQADLGFNPERLEIIDISTQDSFASIFVQEEINNEVGFGRLTGGLPNPGFFSDRGIFGTVFFKGKNAGVTRIEFLPSSLVLANDGRGTNVLKELVSVSYLILPEKISEEEEELQKSVVLKPVVLGETTQETQMKFYEEKKVLGAQAELEAAKKESFLRKIRRLSLGLLEKFNSFVLSSWARVLGL